MSFAKTLKLGRANKQLTQVQLAQKLHIKTGTLCYWEQGHYIPEYTIRRQISLILDIEFEDTPIQPNTFGQQLNLIRHQLGLSRNKFAQPLNIHYQTLIAWEADKHLPREEKIVQICKTYQIKASQLLINSN